MSLYYASLQEVGRRIQSHDLSPVDLTRMMLDRIAKVDPRLKSYATVMSEQALADASAALKEIQAGRYRGHFTVFPSRSRISATPEAFELWAALPF